MCEFAGVRSDTVKYHIASVHKQEEFPIWLIEEAEYKSLLRAKIQECFGVSMPKERHRPWPRIKRVSIIS